VQYTVQFAFEKVLKRQGMTFDEFLDRARKVVEEAEREAAKVRKGRRRRK